MLGYSEKDRAQHLSWGRERLLWWPLRIWTAFTQILNSAQLLIKKFFRLLLWRVGCPQEAEAEGSKVVKMKKKTKKKMKKDFILWDFILNSAMRWNSQSQSWTFFKQEIWEASLNDTGPKLQSCRQSHSPVRRNILLHYCLCPVPKNGFFKLIVHYFKKWSYPPKKTQPFFKRGFKNKVHCHSVKIN